MGTAIIAVLIILSISSVLTQKFKFKQESSMAIAILGIALALYLTGLINLMKITVYAIYIIAIGCFIYTAYAVIKKKIKIKEFITPAVIIYLIVILAMVKIVNHTNYLNWDEFSHWGANLKAMVKYDLFWSNKIYDGVHVVYTPLAGLVEYFFCKINRGFAEEISYIAINTFIITLLLPILKNTKWNVKDIIKNVLFWFAIYVAIRLFNFELTSIYIDLLLGILFTMGMYLAFSAKEKEDKIMLIMVLISMPILKDTGLLLMGIILMQLFFSKVLVVIIKEKKITKEAMKKFGIIVLILVVSLGLYGTWKIYCKANDRVLDDRHDKNAISEVDIGKFARAITLFHIDNDKCKDIAVTFYDVLNRMKVAGSEKSEVGTAINLLIILDIIGIILYCNTEGEEEKRKILIMWISFNIGFILYCLLLLATFMFAFTEMEGRALASYPRYMATYFIAWVMAALAVGIQKTNGKGIIAGILAILLCLYPMNMMSVVDFTTRKGNRGATEEINQKAEIIQENVKLGDKVYLIYQDIGGGLEYHILRYSISPIVTNLMYEWSLGPKYDEEDIWSYDITKEEFEQKLIDEEFDYVFIAKIDKQFMDIYGDLIEDKEINEENYEKLLTNKVLKVNKTNENHVTLEICNK